MKSGEKLEKVGGNGKKWEKVGKVGKSGEKLEKVGKGGEKWEKVGKGGKNGQKWGKVDKSEEKWGKVGKSGKRWGKVGKSAESGEKWRKVAKSGKKCFLKILDKMAAGGHFGCPKITFDHSSCHFRSIRNFYFFGIFWTKWPPAAILDWTTMSVIELVRDIWMNNACVKFEELSLNPSKVIALTTKL